MNKNIYGIMKGNSLFDKMNFYARKKIYNVLVSQFPENESNSVIDVGVTADRDCESSNYFEKMYPYPHRITALSDQDASWMPEAYAGPHGGVRFVRGDALNMPFEDNSFDMAFSHAVIEHVGSRADQLRFIRECMRVSKKYVFITTPDRFYPMELHTFIPLLHWLPPNVYRSVLRRIGKEFFACENNLNLLSRKDLIAVMRNTGHENYKIGHIRFLGFKSNLLLMIKK